MIKKWNAVCSWMLTLFLLGHMLTMSIPVLTGGQDYSDCQILAGGMVCPGFNDSDGMLRT